MRFERLSVEAPGLSAAARDRVTRALAGASVTYTQSARGEVTARAAEVDDVTLRPVVDALLQSLDQVTPRLPEAAVRVGDAWTDARTLRLAPVPGTDVNLRCETEFTLRALRPDGAAVLGLRVTLATPEGARLAGVPFRAEGAATGEAVVDLPRGLVRESRNRGELAVRLTVRGRAVDLTSRFENEVRAEPRAR
jgi:hypothetical protein